MTQMIKAKVEIAIPENFELVDTEEIQKLRQQSLTGQTWTMADLRQRLGKKSGEWINANILENPKYSREIQTMINHNELHEGHGKGHRWIFKASTMAAFIERHWEEFNW